MAEDALVSTDDDGPDTVSPDDEAFEDAFDDAGAVSDCGGFGEDPSDGDELVETAGVSFVGLGRALHLRDDGLYGRRRHLGLFGDDDGVFGSYG